MAKLTQTERRARGCASQLKDRSSAGRLRLRVFRSDKNIYAQIIDDRRASPWRRHRASRRI